MAAGVDGERARAAVMAGRMRSAVLLGLRICVSVGMLAYLVLQFGGAEGERRLFSLDIWGFASATVIIGAQLVLTAVRWAMIMKRSGIPTRFGHTLRILFISNWFNQVLPSMVGGDAVRVWLLSRAGVNWRLAGKTVIIDRVVALVAILTLIALTFPVFWSLSGHAGARTTMALLLGCGVAGLGTLLVLDLVPRRLHRSAPVALMAALARAIRAVLFDPVSGPGLVALAVAIHVLTVVAVLVLVESAGASLAPIAALAFVPPVILLSAVPISIGSWGVREGAMIASLSLVGIEPSLALAISIQIGLAFLANGLVGGVLWLMEPGRAKVPRTGSAG
jgi:uncharacterized membrane protein YbhN (UPF0104 family)